MTETVRVRDEDYNRVQFVKEKTGLSSAEAVHYLIRSGAASATGSDLAERLYRDMTRMVRWHPRWDDDWPEEAKREFVNSLEFQSAESLYDDQGEDGAITLPEFVQEPP